jgi:hypothetical protein
VSRPPGNLCRSCGQDFGSVQAFDLHRIGDHAQLWSPEHPNGRRCLSISELEQRGFRRNTRGRWSKSSYLTGEGTLTPPKLATAPQHRPAQLPACKRARKASGRLTVPPSAPRKVRMAPCLANSAERQL